LLFISTDRLLYFIQADVFVTAKLSVVVDVKNQRNTTVPHAILRELDHPVSKMSMDNPGSLFSKTILRRSCVISDLKAGSNII
jgi:hypothetical protein